MLTAIVLTVLAVLFRVVSSTFHLWNFAPLGAVSLFAGSRLPRRWAWVVPVAAMAISDYLIDQDRYRPLFESDPLDDLRDLRGDDVARPSGQSAQIRPMAASGPLARAARLLFFLTSNLATWAEGLLYPMTFSGLILCYVKAIPFFGNTIAADLLGTARALRPGTDRRASREARWHGLDLAASPIEVHASDSSRPA